MALVQSAQSGDFSNGAELGAPTARLDRFLSEVHPPTPFIVLDLDIVRARYAALRQALPEAAIYYAVKANPATEIVAALAALGASFDHEPSAYNEDN